MYLINPLCVQDIIQFGFEFFNKRRGGLGHTNVHGQVAVSSRQPLEGDLYCLCDADVVYAVHVT